jgi:hypothetical protein
MFDEGLGVSPVQHSGEHYQIDCGAFQPAVQYPVGGGVEYVMTGDSSLEQTRERIRQGPPRP